MYDADGMELLLLLPLLPPPTLLDLDPTPSEEDRSFEKMEAERSLVSLIALSASSTPGYTRFFPFVVAVAADAGGGR